MVSSDLMISPVARKEEKRIGQTRIDSWTRGRESSKKTFLQGANPWLATGWGFLSL